MPNASGWITQENEFELGGYIPIGRADSPWAAGKGAEVLGVSAALALDGLS